MSPLSKRHLTLKCNFKFIICNLISCYISVSFLIDWETFNGIKDTHSSLLSISTIGILYYMQPLRVLERTHFVFVHFPFFHQLLCHPDYGKDIALTKMKFQDNFTLVQMSPSQNGCHTAPEATTGFKKISIKTVCTATWRISTQSFWCTEQKDLLEHFWDIVFELGVICARERDGAFNFKIFYYLDPG